MAQRKLEHISDEQLYACCDMWLEFMKDKRLDWEAIQKVYREDLSDSGSDDED